MTQFFPLKTFTFALFVCMHMFAISSISAQTLIEGRVTDATSGDPLVGATVAITDGSAGANTDDKGLFSFTSPKAPPFEIRVAFASYEQQIISITESGQDLDIKMESSSLAEVEIVASASQERQRQSPLTLESMSINAIKETPAADFYEGLGHLKGVDLNSASIGFKVVNTRGFNSATPVRSLQVIDGVDNQSPGLNFSLGNFLGASELDLESVDLIVGASSAFYGPNAFNGVISMQTKSPFIHTGLSVSAQVGERSKRELGLRYARAFKNAKGEDKLAFKVNGYYLSVRDWEADNLDPYFTSPDGANNPGGYDAVNRYGDEYFLDQFTNAGTALFPGLRRAYRTGYMESDVIDYDTRNYKASAALHYMVTPKIEAIAAFNTAGGTLVMQTLNRLRLDNISFYQSRLELRQRGRFFLRAYRTWEDAGDSYDAYFTANRMQEIVKPNNTWQTDYTNFWAGSLRSDDPFYIPPTNGIAGITGRAFALEGFPPRSFPFDFDQANAILDSQAGQDSLQMWHAMAQAYANQNGLGRLEPGTAAFDSLFNIVTSTPLSQGGTRLVDRSALNHIHGEYKINPTFLDEVVVGGNMRWYLPITEGNFLSDTLISSSTDSSFNRIRNSEFGAYLGLEKKLVDDRLKLNATLRVDKNQNFDLIPTTLLSGVFQANKNHTFRLSFTTAVRNPTLADQYLYYRTASNVFLIGNLGGFDQLADTASFADYLASSPKDSSIIQYYDVDPIRPERVRTIEVGYRASFENKIFLDASYYYSEYRDFIGYNIGLDFIFLPNSQTVAPSSITVYRVAANATEIVTTQGLSVGLDYFFGKGYTIGGNYSWNKLNTQTNDPIIPAFNTPEHKFNLKFAARDVTIAKMEHVGFNVNYKWVDGFFFEGSPTFTGFIPSYGMLDMQINKRVPSLNTTFKLGASNVLNNQVFTIYGGPRVGRLAYFAVTTELSKL